MNKCEQLYEGKAKKVFATEDPEYVIVSYKDDATAFDGLKKGTISGKGVVNNRMSNYLMKLLEKQGVPTHYVEELSDRETVVRKVSIVPLEVIIRNVSAGSFAKRYGVEEGIVLKKPTVEFSYLPSRQSSFPTRTTIFTILCSIHTMRLLSDLQPVRRSRTLRIWHSRSILFSKSISRASR